MKILLAACNAKYIHSNLAVYDLRAYASAYQEHILLREYTINQTKDEILKDIYLTGADVVCFSCYIWNISFVKDLLCDLHKILPETKFWAGGPEVSFDAEAFLRKTPYAVFPPFVRGIEVLVDMPVDRHGESRTDGGFFQQERIESIRYQQVVHKIFHGCNL